MKKTAICHMVPHGEARDRQPHNRHIYSRAPTSAVAPLDNLKTTTRSQQHSGSPRRRAGNACKAYRLHYDTKNMKPGTVGREARRLLSNPLITPYIRKLQKEHRQLRNGPMTVRMTG